jgi:hypothetical protein
MFRRRSEEPLSSLRLEPARTETARSYPSRDTLAGAALALQRVAGNGAVSRLIAPGKPPEDGMALPAELQDAIESARDGGQPLESGTREYLEMRLETELGDVRVHAGDEADALGAALDARAFTTGRDIFFREGEYNPGTDAGRRLISHEVAHVLQQGGRRSSAPLTVGPRNDPYEREANYVAEMVTVKSSPQTVGPSRVASDKSATIRRWATLGQWAWDNPINRSRVVVPVKVGTEAEWTARLKDMDDEDEFREYLQGFLEAVTDSAATTRKFHPLRFENFENTLTKTPTEADVLAFLRPLYSLGKDLDLPTHTFEMTGVSRLYLQELLSKLIRTNQHLVLQAFSAKGEVVPEHGVREVAGQGGALVRNAMIQNAGATALKAIDLVTAANRLPHQAKAKSDERAVAKRNAFELIRNSGRTIRHVLEEHKAIVEFNEFVNRSIFEGIWGMIPGGEGLTRAGQQVLRMCFREMVKKASESNEPVIQAEGMNAEFVKHVNMLVPHEITVEDANGAINGFEAVRR